MLHYNLDKLFPELVGLPTNIQQEIVGQARTEAFTTVKESNSKFIWRFFGIGVLSLITAQIISYLTGVSNTLILCIFGGLGAFFAIHQQQGRWARQMRPKVRELAEQYRSGKGFKK